ncbi:MAG TPA: prephenate dehydratase domain-containing protein [Candidatus Saccharimonadales bacterium]|nr:prephenate dehydratase domain-containing protein [Candidatus Saccharimonadales bacterium]
MSETPKIVATQGDEGSYSVEAARALFGASVPIHDCGSFGKVIRETRQEGPKGMGVIPVKTAKGAVERSMAELVKVVPDALPDITGRVDLDVSLVLVSAQDQGLADVTRPEWMKRVYVHAHREAWRQSEAGVRALLDRPNYRGSTDNIQAVKTIKEIDRRDTLAIGPAHAVEPFGVYQIGEGQVNPPNSVTRFYGLQLDPRIQLIFPDEEKTARRSVLSITHPQGAAAMQEVLELFESQELRPMDFISFPTNGDPRHGGIFEIAGDLYAPRLREFCARVSRIRDSDGERGSFMTRILGGFDWYPEYPMDLDTFANRYGATTTDEQSLVVRQEPAPND